MRKGLLVGAAVVAALLPAAGSAQMAWDSPMLLPPNAAEEFGLYLVDVHGGGLGVMGMWRETGYGFGIRGGLAEGRGDDIGIFGGIDFSGTLTRSSNEFPLDVDWVVGAGLGAEDGVRLSFPAGLSVGHTFEGDGVFFTPYATPRVVLDAFLGAEDRPDSEDLELELGVDVGLDLRFSSDFTIRFGATLGDRSAVAIGVAF